MTKLRPEDGSLNRDMIHKILEQQWESDGMSAITFHMSRAVENMMVAVEQDRASVARRCAEICMDEKYLDYDSFDTVRAVKEVIEKEFGLK